MQSLKVKSTLTLKGIVLVYDQTLYAKATEVQWKQSERVKDIVLRMSIPHSLHPAVHYWDRDLSVECGVIAQGSVAGVLYMGAGIIVALDSIRSCMKPS